MALDWSQPDKSQTQIFTMNTEQIKETIHTLYTEVFNNGKADLLASLVSGPYIQHNPMFPNGTGALEGFLKQAGSLPNQIKRIAIQDDLAFVHVLYPEWAGKPHAAVDIFRFDNEAKIVEHWDVIQPVQEETASGNPMI
jgi:predicted SnoaL-like aldol condensation-catalyzing enzyme